MTKKTKKIIANGKVVTQERVIPLGGVAVCGGVITEVFEGCGRKPSNDEQIIDADGKYISPGFIDIHVHGGGGYEFLSAEKSEIISALMTHMKHGTTSISPTLSSAGGESVMKTVSSINDAKSEMKGGPNVLGIHLEGPYFAMSQRGAQNPRYIRDPDKAEYMEIIGKFDNILRWSLAPELPGALEMAEILTARGIRVSIGHSDALYDETVKAYEHGFNTVTHFYSCTSTVRRINAYKHAGIIEAAYQIDDMMVEIIADGKHLPPSLLKLVYKIKGPERICLITDGISAAGLKDAGGKVFDKAGGLDIIIEDDVAKLPDRSAFAGSIATADKLVRNMVTKADVPLFQDVKMASATPAKNVGVFNRKGSIAPGKDADILLFNDNIDIAMVMVGGNITYSA